MHTYIHSYIHTYNIELGKYTFPNGDVYEGPFEAGKMHGSGILTLHSHRHRTIPASSKQPPPSSSSSLPPATAFHPPRMEGVFESGQLISTKAPKKHTTPAPAVLIKLPPITTTSNSPSPGSPGPATHTLSSIDEHEYEHPGYIGPLDENGLKHGKGVFIYSNNMTYIRTPCVRMFCLHNCECVCMCWKFCLLHWLIGLCSLKINKTMLFLRY